MCVCATGTPDSNRHVKTVCERTGRLKLPIEWSPQVVAVSGGRYQGHFDSATHIPSLIYPSCFSGDVLGKCRFTCVCGDRDTPCVFVAITCILVTNSRAMCGVDSTRTYMSCMCDARAHACVAGNYVVLNSGITSREGHDHNNSLQNPHLPDWAIIDVSQQPPTRLTPGAVRAADFFDEQWQLK
jgi:hypothetical protein